MIQWWWIHRNGKDQKSFDQQNASVWSFADFFVSSYQEMTKWRLLHNYFTQKKRLGDVVKTPCFSRDPREAKSHLLLYDEPQKKKLKMIGTKWSQNIFLPKKGGGALIESQNRILIKHHQNPQVNFVFPRFLVAIYILTFKSRFKSKGIFLKESYTFTPNQKNKTPASLLGVNF